MLLKTLYNFKFDKRYYNIVNLLKDEGVKIDFSEAREICKTLKDGNLINAIFSLNSVSASINGPGVEFVEEELLSDQTDYSPDDKINSSERTIIITKLEELESRLSKIELGQQITYDDIHSEINEIKALTLILGKRNLFQILKGKLIDIGLGKLSEKGVLLLMEVFKNEILLK